MSVITIQLEENDFSLDDQRDITGSFEVEYWEKDYGSEDDSVTRVHVSCNSLQINNVEVDFYQLSNDDKSIIKNYVESLAMDRI